MRVSTDKGQITTWIRTALTETLLVSTVCLCSASGQFQTATLAVNDSRPVAAAAMDIERRSGLPVNYEDVRYEYPGDLQDITDQIMTAAQKAEAIPGVRVIVARGGSLSVNIVGAANGRLPDFAAVSAAANAVVSAHSASPAHSGSFVVEQGDGVLYIEPLQMRDSFGNIKRITPLLSTHVTFPAQARSGIDALRLILNQVSQASGFKIDVGTAPAKALIATEVLLGANNEPANRVITKLLSGIMAAGADTPYSGPAISYTMFFDPKLRYYALNVHVIPNPNPPKTTRTGAISIPPTNSQRFFNKTIH